MYLAHVVPGLEEIAAREIEALPRAAVVRVLTRFDERTSLLVVRYGGSPHDLLGLQSVEDVFALALDIGDILSGHGGLAAIRSALARARELERAVATALSVRPRRRGRVTFRVIARKAGQHAFRRVDMQRAVERALLERFPAWRLVEDDAQLEVWVSLVGDRLVVGVRLSDISMRQREMGRGQTSRPAALKPTIAHAMVMLSRPRPEDVFLDPMCGTGTILIERARAARYRILLGGDIDPAAVQATRDNVGPRYKPIEIRRWDAARLPLDRGSVSALVTNMPFGRRIGTPEENRARYPALLAEWSRVLMGEGRMVLLTSERGLLRQALRRRTELALEEEHGVLVRGLPAAIFVVRSTVTPVSAAGEG